MILCIHRRNYQAHLLDKSIIFAGVVDTKGNSVFE